MSNLLYDKLDSRVQTLYFLELCSEIAEFVTWTAKLVPQKAVNPLFNAVQQYKKSAIGILRFKLRTITIIV